MSNDKEPVFIELTEVFNLAVTSNKGFMAKAMNAFGLPAATGEVEAVTKKRNINAYSLADLEDIHPGPATKDLKKVTVEEMEMPRSAATRVTTMSGEKFYVQDTRSEIVDKIAASMSKNNGPAPKA